MGSLMMDRQLRENDFQRLSRFIQSSYGIKLPPSKKTMLESRLLKRMKKLGIGDFKSYIDYVFSAEGGRSELIHMMNVVTTNKTDFFREPTHYEYLAQKILPEMVRQFRVGIRDPLRIWSAGCASGEEPYTLAMVLNEFAESLPSFRFTILATDLSSQALEKGTEGIYEEDKTGPIPQALKRKYLLRSRDRSRRQVRIVGALRQQVRFARLNLMDESYAIDGLMDIIFFRNVIIYFSKETQQEIVGRVCRCLREGGYLFVGHSETLFSMDVPLEQAVPTIYRRL